MKIAVVGCGALGSFYGAKLSRAGEEVHFLLRSDYDVVRRHGVAIRSPEGDFRARPRCAKSPEEIGPADLVLIGLGRLECELCLCHEFLIRLSRYPQWIQPPWHPLHLHLGFHHLCYKYLDGELRVRS